jgi:hypothetical protein
LQLYLFVFEPLLALPLSVSGIAPLDLVMSIDGSCLRSARNFRVDAPVSNVNMKYSRALPSKLTRPIFCVHSCS